jgi:hypothetical protein
MAHWWARGSIRPFFRNFWLLNLVSGESTHSLTSVIFLGPIDDGVVVDRAWNGVTFCWLMSALERRETWGALTKKRKELASSHQRLTVRTLRAHTHSACTRARWHHTYIHVYITKRTERPWWQKKPLIFALLSYSVCKVLLLLFLDLIHKLS